MAARGCCLGRLLSLILILVVLAVVVLFCVGYADYKEVIEAEPLAQMVDEVRAGDTFTDNATIGEQFLTMIVVVEDKRFWEHGAIDLLSIGRALATNIREHGLVAGGSTITQQVARNLYFTQEKRFTRKIAEMFVARDLERCYTKEEILELYCNIIYFGESYYDVASASWGYFHKEVAELSFEECAMLAGIPNAPSLYNPVADPELAAERQQVVLAVLADNGITAEDF